LRSFVRQLCSFKVNGKPVTNEELLTAYKNSRADGHAAGNFDTEECQKLIDAFVNQYPQTTLVIDSLDQYGDESSRGELLDFLHGLRSKSDKPLKVFISSRDDYDIRCQLDDDSNIMKRLSSKDTKEDIRLFLNAKVDEKLRRSKTWQRLISHTVLEEAIQTILDNSRGM
jgi:ankyrin repeat domain-containing protein 50